MPLFKVYRPQEKNKTDLVSTDETNSSMITGAAADIIKLLIASVSQDKTVHYKSDGSFYNHHLLEGLLNKFGAADVFFSTYALSEDPARALFKLKQSGLIKKLHALCDKRVHKNTAAPYQLLCNTADTITNLNCHAKVMVVCFPDFPVTIISSSNWTRNPRIEAGYMTTNPDVANMHLSWLKPTDGK